MTCDGFAQAVTVGDDVGRLEVQDIQYGEVEPECGERISARRKQEGGIGSARARPLHIKRGLNFISVLSGVRAIGINLLEVAVFEVFQAKCVAKGVPIGFMEEIGIFDQSNGDPFARKSTLPERQNIVDGREVIRANGVKSLVAIFDVKARVPLLGSSVI